MSSTHDTLRNRSVPYWKTLVFAVFAAFLAGAQAQAAYKLAGGDVVNVEVFGVPELQTKSQVDIDGNISFPLIGKVKVRGLTVEEVRSLVATTFIQRAAETSRRDDTNTFGQITPNEITVSVAEYRPVYVTGDVAHSGAEPFRPGLTVQQAIALAGGVDSAHGSSSGQSPEDRVGLTIDYARVRGKIWRLEQESEWVENGSQQGSNPAPRESLNSILAKVPIAPNLISQIVTSESEQLKLDQSAWDKEYNYAKQAADQIGEQLKLLLQQQVLQQTDSQQVAHDSQQVRALYTDHLATLDRMASVRRDSTSVLGQILQIDSLIIQAHRELNALDQRKRQFEMEQRISKVRELEDSRMEFAKITAKLANLGTAFTAPEDQTSSPTRMRQSISIARDVEGTVTVLSADQNTELAPGDTVNVNAAGLTE